MTKFIPKLGKQNTILRGLMNGLPKRKKLKIKIEEVNYINLARLMKIKENIINKDALIARIKKDVAEDKRLVGKIVSQVKSAKKNPQTRLNIEEKQLRAHLHEEIKNLKVHRSLPRKARNPQTGGAFLAGKKFSEKKEANQVKTEQKTELEKQLQQLKSQLQRETNPANKQELENKINETNQQIKNLGGSTTPPTPNQNPPPKNPFKTSRQLTVKCNGASGGKCEYINIANSQERVLIDTKNKIFYSDDALYIKGNQYVITFNEEDAQKKGNNFIFDENNNKIKLTLATPIPKPVPSQIEIEVK
ncbi:11384_t:CDS:2 [Paraglomus brasilianum]|uniref:11384_t:CDS:1 n=1 Tax=Paraglomus brasilianum TaxID=144538 RepID=A0A9N9AXK1_9GLOM|nr:11384_t:CDS:2 [Paraglomus brasilianum]